MKKLNILFLVRTWALGGAQTLIRMYIHHLPKDRFNVITVPYDAPGDGDQDFVDSVIAQGDEVSDERIPWQARSHWSLARDKVEALIEQYDIDIIHTHDNLSNILIGLGRKRWQCACVASAYGWWEPKWNLKRRGYHWVERNIALPAFDRVYTVSNDMKRKVLWGRTPESRIRVNYTGLLPHNFQSARSRQSVREELGIPEDAIVLGSVSRLYKEKGHHYLLDSAAELLQKHPRIHVLLVGTGYWQETLEKQTVELGISEKTTFTGYYESLPDALQAMDIFVQPSLLEEGLPTSLLEAQAAGLPVIASDIGGTRETMEIGVTGELPPTGDGPALTAALDKLVSDEALRLRMGESAAERIKVDFTQDAMMNRMGEIYEEAWKNWQQAN